MFLLMAIGRTLLGMWRLMIGLAIGMVLYVWMFFSYKEYWEQIQNALYNFMQWLMGQSWLSDYSQWNTLLHLDDKLAFALYIVVGRLLWLAFEGVFISFPYWLVAGRHRDREVQAALHHYRLTGDSSAAPAPAGDGRKRGLMEELAQLGSGREDGRR